MKPNNRKIKSSLLIANKPFSAFLCIHYKSAKIPYAKVQITFITFPCHNFLWVQTIHQLAYLTNISNCFQCGFFGHVCGPWGGHICNKSVNEVWPLTHWDLCQGNVSHTLGCRAWAILLCSQSSQHLKNNGTKEYGLSTNSTGYWG